ncbi:MAG TPA: hypothetical protein VME46_18940 [Acidimicrobiales bacterium]|nr:hypothetical protein [Acidimicrobiales bacterium]
MGFMDKVVNKAKEVGDAGHAKVDSVQAKRQVDDLYRQIGMLAYAAQMGRSGPAEVEQFKEAVQKLRDLEAGHPEMFGAGVAASVGAPAVTPAMAGQAPMGGGFAPAGGGPGFAPAGGGFAPAGGGFAPMGSPAMATPAAVAGGGAAAQHAAQVPHMDVGNLYQRVPPAPPDLYPPGVFMLDGYGYPLLSPDLQIPLLANGTEGDHDTLVAMGVVYPSPRDQRYTVGGIPSPFEG